MSLSRVILSNPQAIPALSAGESGVKRSWIQLAKTGSFVSQRYGKFDITRDDLAQMLSNYVNVTPKSPTELPIDWDHLSMDPKKPGDGAAAGWMKQVQLRADGDELWAEVEWTPRGADAIQNREYKFVSPSFVKDHTHKDGTKIGTTLLAAAITNHPFLEGMSALTLYNFSAMGDLALAGETATEVEDDDVISLADVGQRIMIAPGHTRTQDEIGATFEIVEVVGEGDDAFVAVKDAQGNRKEWFRATDLLPASATPTATPGQPATAGIGVVAQPKIEPNAQPQQPPVQAATTAAPMQTPPSTPVQPPPVQAATVPPVPPAVPPAGTPVAGPPVAMPTTPQALTPEAIAGAIDILKQAIAAGLLVAKTEEGDDNEQASDEASEGEADESADEESGKSEGGFPPKKKSKKKPFGLATAGETQMKFMLRNDKNENIEVTSEMLAQAGIKVVPEGATAIPTSELSALKESVTSLSSTVTTLQNDAKTRDQESRRQDLRRELYKKVSGGFMLKATADKLYEQFKDATDLAPFMALSETFNTKIVTVGAEHGSGGDAPAQSDGQKASAKIIALSHQLVKERGMNLSQATIEASKQLADDAQAYREQFAER